MLQIFIASLSHLYVVQVSSLKCRFDPAQELMILQVIIEVRMYRSIPGDAGILVRQQIAHCICVLLRSFLWLLPIIERVEVLIKGLFLRVFRIGLSDAFQFL